MGFARLRPASPNACHRPFFIRKVGKTMDYWFNLICRYWPHLAAGLILLAALIASAHALLHNVIPAPQRFGSGSSG